MSSIEAAQAVYQDTVNSGERSAEELEAQLRRRAEEIRQGELDDMSDETRDEISEALSNDDEADVEQVANAVEQAANDVRESLGGRGATIKELPGGVAGQAQLGADGMWIDPNAIQASGGDTVVDKEIAQNIADHEAEHTKQSASADAEGITIGTKEFDSRQIREAAAISVQSRRDFLSAEYKHIIASLPMSQEDRDLVRRGEFKKLEAKKNGQSSTVAA